MEQLITLFSEPATYLSLVTLTVMEIVLGIDNVIFISIVAGKLRKEQQAAARTIGLALAFFFRVLLLLFIGWIVGLTKPLFTVLAFPVSGRDLILLGGGLFLIAKSVTEIHGKFDVEDESSEKKVYPTFANVVGQIVLLDIVFSFDSVITAVGLVKDVPIMIIAVMISLGIMLGFAGKIGSFIEEHPSIKMLALSFLLMIGTLLVAEGCHVHVPKGYVYFAMAFSVFVEVMNVRLRTRRAKVKNNS